MSVSAFATRGLCADVFRVSLTEHDLIISETVLEELRRVLETKFQVPGAVVEDTEAFLRGQAVVVSDAPALSLDLKDASDILVVAEGVKGNADVLITGDRDMLMFAGQAPLPIISPRSFWERLRSGREHLLEGGENGGEGAGR